MWVESHRVSPFSSSFRHGVFGLPSYHITSCVTTYIIATKLLQFNNYYVGSIVHVHRRKKKIGEKKWSKRRRCVFNVVDEMWWWLRLCFLFVAVELIWTLFFSTAFLGFLANPHRKNYSSYIASINIDKGFMYNPCSHSPDSCLAP